MTFYKFAGAWKRRGHPDSHEAGVGPFDRFSSRSVLDAVVEEEMSEEEDEEEEEDSIVVLGNEVENEQESGQAAMILVHDSRMSRSSCSSSNASSNKLNLDV